MRWLTPDEDVIQQGFSLGQIGSGIHTSVIAAPPGNESSWMVLGKAGANMAKNRHAAPRERGGPWSVTSCLTPLSCSALLLQHIDVFKVSSSNFWLRASAYPSPYLLFTRNSFLPLPSLLFLTDSFWNWVHSHIYLQHYSEPSLLLRD